MADDVEALIAALGLEDAVVIGWSFGSFVTQSHMVRHGSASAYVLMGTVSHPGALANLEHELAIFEPEALRAQVAASWALEATVETPEQAKQLLADQMPFHVADPTGPLVAELIAADRVVYRPDVLRHFAAGGEYGMSDLRDDLRSMQRPTLILSGANDRTTPAASARQRRVPSMATWNGIWSAGRCSCWRVSTVACERPGPGPRLWLEDRDYVLEVCERTARMGDRHTRTRSMAHHVALDDRAITTRAAISASTSWPCRST